MDCPKHGRQGLAWMCKHLERHLVDKQFLPYRKVRYDYLCTSCYKGTASRYIASIPILSSAADAWTCYRLGHKYGGCPECLKEIHYHAAKQAGQQLPFVGYENTLNWSHLEEVEKLETALQHRFVFQPCRRPIFGPTSSMFCLPGSFTEPLTIIIHYVIEPAEQEAILAFINAYFIDHDLPQRRICFYEVERWYGETRGNSHTCQSLEGVLLREIVVA